MDKFLRRVHHLPEYFSEMVTIDAVGNGQRKGPGFMPQTPQQELPEISLMPAEDPQIQEGAHQGQNGGKIDSQWVAKRRLIFLQK